jgi:hypothetical protein
MGTYSESCLKYNIKNVCLLHFESLQNELKCCIHLSAKGVLLIHTHSLISYGKNKYYIQDQARAI